MKKAEPTYWHEKNVVIYRMKSCFFFYCKSWCHEILTLHLRYLQNKLEEKQCFILHALGEICMQGWFEPYNFSWSNRGCIFLAKCRSWVRLDRQWPRESLHRYYPGKRILYFLGIAKDRLFSFFFISRLFFQF